MVGDQEVDRERSGWGRHAVAGEGVPAGEDRAGAGVAEGGGDALGSGRGIGAEQDDAGRQALPGTVGAAAVVNGGAGEAERDQLGGAGDAVREQGGERVEVDDGAVAGHGTSTPQDAGVGVAVRGNCGWAHHLGTTGWLTIMKGRGGRWVGV